MTQSRLVIVPPPASVHAEPWLGERTTRPAATVEHELAVCVPTYRRPHLLARLLGDLTRQTRRPELMIIVDGNPGSGEVKHLLSTIEIPAVWSLAYIPSSHANLPFQRYLGWRIARRVRWLLYLDDDLRLRQQDALERLIRPLQTDGSVAGVTTQITYPAKRTAADRLGGPLSSRLAKRFGSARRTAPGGVTPTGHRRHPRLGDPEYTEVEWLRGGVMAFRMTALSEKCFSNDLFAMHHIGAGLGEDTVLARKARMGGRLVLARNVEFEHPDADRPRAYPTGGFRFGFATAYSRRMINETYRGFGNPHLADRIELLKSYAGNTVLHFGRAVRRPSVYRWLFTLGYLRGALAGAAFKPTAGRLTPDIDWRADAETSLSAATRIERLAATVP